MLISAGDSVTGDSWSSAWTTAAYPNTTRKAMEQNKFFVIKFLSSLRNVGGRSGARRPPSALVSWAEAARERRATGLTWAFVHTVSSVVCRSDKRKNLKRWRGWLIYPVT